MNRIFRTTLAALLCGTAAQADARGLGAHEHGSGSLDIAFEGDAVLMEFEAPGADIVGFEHAARSAEDRAAVDAAISTLARPLELFVISAEAGCVVSAASVELVGGGDDHDDDHGHAEHAQGDHDHDHGRSEHAHGHGDDDHGHAEHAHDDGSSHAEFHAEYALTCADPDAIEAIDFLYFTTFPNALKLDVQMISDRGARGFEVERDAPRLDLAGAI